MRLLNLVRSELICERSPECIDRQQMALISKAHMIVDTVHKQQLIWSSFFNLNSFNLILKNLII